jgi:signal transduction histidine kinase
LLFGTRSFGMGLGLPTARKIVEQHGGTIAVASEPGEGTRVTITLPLSTKAAESKNTNGAEPVRAVA